MKARLTKKTVLPDWLLISDAKMPLTLSNRIKNLRNCVEMQIVKNQKASVYESGRAVRTENETNFDHRVND